MYVSAMSMRLCRGRSTPTIRAMTYPWRCLWRGFLHVTRTTPLRLTTLQSLQIFLTDARTFIFPSGPPCGGSRPCENFRPAVRHRDGVLEMRRPPAVRRDRCPAVVEHAHARSSQVYHRPDRDHHSGLERPATPRCTVVGHLR